MSKPAVTSSNAQKVSADHLVEANLVFAHATACIDSGCDIGIGTQIWHYSHVMHGARLGKRCVLGQNVFVGRDVKIGDGVKVQNNVSVYEGVELEDDVFVGPSAVFTNDLRPRAAFPKGRSRYVRTRVCRGATIGANATIVAGVTIGESAMIGAGSVIITDVPPFTLVAGVPARTLSHVCACGAALDRERDCGSLEFPCTTCERVYHSLPGSDLRLLESPG